MANVQLSERIAVVAAIDPDAYATGTQGTDTVDMRYHDRVMFIVQVGTLGSSATVDFKVQESANGTSWSDLSGKSITQLTDAGSDDDKQAIVEVAAAELSSGKRYLRGVLTIGTASSDAGVIALGDCRYEPVEDFDLSSVDEIVA